MSRTTRVQALVGPAAAAATAFLLLGAEAVAADLASPWVDGYNSRARLVAGTNPTPGQQAGPGLIAGIEIAIAKGWKTYWRTPGDSGGVPPNIDLSASENLAAGQVLYPAPERLADPTGDAIGYKDSVTFPITIRAADPTRPIVLTVQLEFGICREICVPAEARLSLTVPPGLTAPLPRALREAMAKVPAKEAERRPNDPRLVAGRALLTGAKPMLAFEVAYPAGSAGADLFIEAPDGLYLPVPKKTGENGSTVAFEVDVSSGVTPKDLVGKTLVLTAVSNAGRAELTWVVP